MSRAEAAVTDVEAILAEGGDADDALRRTVVAVRERGGYAWAGLFFVEDNDLTLGPEAGEPAEATRLRVPVLWQDVKVAELTVDGADAGDTPALERVATLIAGHCLVGWDTGGESWEP